MELADQLTEAGECLVLARNPGAPEVLAELAERLHPLYGWGLLAECREAARGRVLDDPLDIESNLLLSWFTAAIAVRGALDREARSVSASPMIGSGGEGPEPSVDLTKWGPRLREAVGRDHRPYKAVAREAQMSWQTLRELCSRDGEPVGRQRAMAQRVLAVIGEDPAEWFEDEPALSTAAEA